MPFDIEKSLVRSYYAALDGTDDPHDVLGNYVAEDWVWRAFHPFGECRGAQQVATVFWLPFKKALRALHRRQDIFFAGHNALNDSESTWVVSMGHLVGLFDAPFLGIPPTGRMAFFRYCEFNRIAAGRIAETAFYFDLPHLMAQAGVSIFADQRGAQLVQPGPIAHDGLLFHDAPPEEGEQTLAAINAMISDLGQWNLPMPLTEELRRTWHEDMIWWGPTGIGATYTIARYAQQHAAPFRAAFTERSKTNHICRVAEGNFGGFFGWPNFSAVLQEEFLGISPSGVRGEFRVIDLYRRSGGKLAENWVFIDLPHWLSQHGKKVFCV